MHSILLIKQKTPTPPPLPPLPSLCSVQGARIEGEGV